MKTFFKSIASILVGFFLFYLLYLVVAFLFLLFVDRFPELFGTIYRLAEVAYLHTVIHFGLTAIPSIVPAIIVQAIMKNESDKAAKCTAVVTIAAAAVSVFVGMEFDFTNWLFTLLGIAVPFWSFVVGE